MAITTLEAVEQMLKETEGDQTALVRPEVGAIEAISRSEISAQLDAAHKYPRSATRFLKEAIDLVTYSREIAEACMYSLPRGGKMLTGKSVRLAEICASCYGNMHVGARVIDIGPAEVTAQAIAWDLERNVRITIEAQRGIVGKRGRYDDDMIRVTGMAAISVALRNAIFRVIPGALTDAVYAKAKAVAIGDVETLGKRRDEVLLRFGRMGVTPERVFARLGVKAVEEVLVEHLELLIGLGTSIKSGEVSLDEAFPPVVPAPAPVAEGVPEGKRVKLPGKKGETSNDNGGAA
jgi:hypothetical protein